MTDRYDADIHARWTWEHDDEPAIRSTGPRREAPGLCPECGEDVTHPSQFDPTCGEADCRERWVLRRGPINRWLAMGEETRS